MTIPNQLVHKRHVGRRFAAALLPRLFGTNPRSLAHHKGATGRVTNGFQYTILPYTRHDG